MIKTKRLRIYPASKNQMESLIASQTDDGLKAAYTEMLENSLQHPDKREWYALWIIELHDGTNIGGLCFKGIDAKGTAEIGYGISEEYQNQGFATETVKAVCEWAFRNPELTSITAETDSDNEASKRVLVKCGFTADCKSECEGLRFTLTRVLDRKATEG
ncbi:MAG: GNAT family N-acetyltransferase [Synergistaceae bacterium]|nr:GNAT family N-acetyltransferase [Synergistaceae bacterium]